jgi:hypothetical protein
MRHDSHEHDRGENVKRHLFNTLAAMSFMLCMATAAVWITNPWRPMFFGRPQIAVGDLYIHGENGQTSFSWTPQPSAGPWDYGSGNTAKPWYLPMSDSCTWHAAEFGLDAPQGNGNIHFVIPSWFIVAVTILLPIVWLIRFRPAMKQGLCPACGYDLRATPNRCPECGKIPQILN